VPHATDRYGGYNALDMAGKRHMFVRATVVELEEARTHEIQDRTD
jgi:hypothetical protein